jgi:hypothetical protein
MENQNKNPEETTLPQNSFTSEMMITPEGKKALKSMSVWMRFCAVLGFIGCAFSFLGGLIVLFSGSMLSNTAAAAIPTKGLGFGYIFITIMLFFPFLYLNRSCNALNNALMNGSNEELEAGLVNMKSYWKYIGIFAIIVLAILPLSLIMFLVGS